MFSAGLEMELIKRFFLKTLAAFLHGAILQARLNGSISANQRGLNPRHSQANDAASIPLQMEP